MLINILVNVRGFSSVIVPITRMRGLNGIKDRDALIEIMKKELVCEMVDQGK